MLKSESTSADNAYQIPKTRMGYQMAKRRLPDCLSNFSNPEPGCVSVKNSENLDFQSNHRIKPANGIQNRRKCKNGFIQGKLVTKIYYFL